MKGEPEGFFDPTSSRPEMTSSKIFRFSINFRNSEDYNPYAIDENDRIRTYQMVLSVFQI